MSVTLKVRSNEDDALLFWSIPAPIPGCRGFAIERKKTPPEGALVQGFLVNRIGFDTDGSAPVDEHGAARSLPPSGRFRRFHGLITTPTVATRFNTASCP